MTAFEYAVICSLVKHCMWPHETHFKTMHRTSTFVLLSIYIFVVICFLLTFWFMFTKTNLQTWSTQLATFLFCLIILFACYTYCCYIWSSAFFTIVDGLLFLFLVLYHFCTPQQGLDSLTTNASCGTWNFCIMNFFSTLFFSA